jgi:hypothetical protein
MFRWPPFESLHWARLYRNLPTSETSGMRKHWHHPDPFDLMCKLAQPAREVLALVQVSCWLPQTSRTGAADPIYCMSYEHLVLLVASLHCRILAVLYVGTVKSASGSLSMTIEYTVGLCTSTGKLVLRWQPCWCSIKQFLTLDHGLGQAVSQSSTKWLFNQSIQQRKKMSQ